MFEEVWPTTSIQKKGVMTSLSRDDESEGAA